MIGGREESLAFLNREELRVLLDVRVREELVKLVVELDARMQAVAPRPEQLLGSPQAEVFAREERRFVPHRLIRDDDRGHLGHIGAIGAGH